LLAAVSVVLLAFTVHAVRQSSDINRQLSQMNNNIATLDSEKATAERMLALPQNRGTVEKSQYLNKIFARKAFSWTTVFSDMEKLMPPGLRVLSITPALDDQNQLQVHIMVGGESRERAIELVRNLEKTPRFRDVALRSDTMETSSTTGSSASGEHDPVRFDIVALYVPAPASTRGKASEEASAGRGGAR
jgi:type IV pilus assembly protein PilN